MNSFLEVFFKDYAMALWTILITAIILLSSGTINQSQYFTLTSVWAPPFLVLAPMTILKPGFKNKLFKPSMFLITTLILFIFNSMAIGSTITIQSLLVDYALMITIALTSISIWTLINNQLKKKINKVLTTFLTSSMIIGLNAIILTTLKMVGVT